MTELTLKPNWKPRAYQLPIYRYMREGGTRALGVWHRRAGKDATVMNWTREATQRRVGTYWHMLPTLQQGRKVIWEGINKDGTKKLDTFEPEMITSVNNTDMKLGLQNGSIWQVTGSDNFDSLVGSNPIGVVFSEWSLTDPMAWEFIRPILRENGGWAIFIYTPRGRNHGYDLLKVAQRNEDWFSEILTVDDTGIMTPEDIQKERDEGMSPDMIAQEYYCSFDASLHGAYYATQMAKALDDGRITGVPHQPEHPVETWWDIGIGDSTAIWFVQYVGREIHLIDYYETSGEGLAHYAKVLTERSDREGYNYAAHVAPHDIVARELGTGKARIDVAREHGIRFRVAPKMSIDDGIEQTRNMLSRCWFDLLKTDHGIEALRQYCKQWDVKNRIFKDRPHHDWTSHAADAVRMGAIFGQGGVSKGSGPLEYRKLGIV
jgi:phage terminase large subunit